METQPIEITDNDFLRQYEARIEGELAQIEYVEQERKLFMTKLVMSDELKEKGFLDPFIKAVLEEVKKKKTTVMPTSPDIAKFFKKNREYKDMLPTGINI
jgi:predicted GNAT family acetyltransferase